MARVNSEVGSAWYNSFIFLLLYNVISTFIPTAWPYPVRINVLYLIWVLLFLTLITIVTGVCWGKAAWGSYLVLDSKLVFLYIEFLLLTVFLYLKQAFDWSDRYFHLVTLSFFIVSPFLKHISSWIAGLHQTSSINMIKLSLSIEIFLLVIWVSLFFLFSIIHLYRFYIKFSNNMQYTQTVRQFL